MSGPSRAEAYALLSADEQASVRHDLGGARGFAVARRSWWWLARAAQFPPRKAWRTWLVMAGRGFGKTRTGAEWVQAAARDPEARIALVGATLHDTRAVMIEGESGLLRAGFEYERPAFEPSNRRLVWPSGAEARFYSADEPDSLRGGQHSHAWGDEIAKWAHGRDAWMNLSMGLRLGGLPQAVLTTTPRPVELIKVLIADASVAKTFGRTADNAANLAPGFVAALEESYGGTRLGRQELDGELIEDIAGALWTRAVLEGCRVRWPLGRDPLSPLGLPPESPSPQWGEGQVGPAPSPRRGEGWGEGTAPGVGLGLRRVVVAVDPPASAHGDACGIVVGGLGEDGRAYVLADLSVERAAPEAWAAAVAAAVEALGADKVVAEANNGGDMVSSVLAASGLAMPVKLVRASRGKVARAEPVAALYAAGRVRHAGVFPELEDQLCGLVAGGGYAGPGRSPDRADALVWALTELMLGPAERRPGIRGL